MDRRAVPRFAELPVRRGAPPGSSWGVFGEDDELGTLNFVGPEQVRAAAALARTGRVFSLNWELGLPSPAFFLRRPPRHTIFDKYGGLFLDDWLDDFFLQGSTQWDGLRHVSDPDYGWYSGAARADVDTPGCGRLGIERWAQRGLVARAVLVDAARALGREGVRIDPFDFFPIGPDLLARIAARENVQLRPGDVLLVRTGWIEAYEGLSAAEREELARGRAGSPGLYGEEMTAFLWDNRIAAVAADNPALEAAQPGSGSELPLHRALIARLGMPLGELWALGGLATDCALDGVYECLLTSAPLNLRGGVGSPANALAIK